MAAVRWRLAARLGSALAVVSVLAGACATSFDIEHRVSGATADNGVRRGALDPGQCFSEEELGFTDGVPVACIGPHIAEFFAVTQRTEPPDAPWPGLEVIQEDASRFCNREFERATGVAGEITALDILFFRPDETTWSAGDREIACFVRYDAPTSQRLVDLDPTRAFGMVSTFALERGDCIADDSLIAQVAVRLVDCAEAHWFEVFASQPMLDGPFPGEAEVLQFVDTVCDGAFEAYVGVPRGQSGFAVERVFPTEQSWDEWDDRVVSCALTDQAQRTGSARGSGL